MSATYTHSFKSLKERKKTPLYLPAYLAIHQPMLWKTSNKNWKKVSQREEKGQRQRDSERGQFFLSYVLGDDCLLV